MGNILSPSLSCPSKIEWVKQTLHKQQRNDKMFSVKHFPENAKIYKLLPDHPPPIQKFVDHINYLPRLKSELIFLCTLVCFGSYVELTCRTEAFIITVTVS